MRYSVSSKTLSYNQLLAECTHYGARNLHGLTLIKQVICDLDETAAQKLATVPGVTVKIVGKKIHPMDFRPTRIKPSDFKVAKEGAYETSFYPCQPIYASSQASLSTLLYDLRDSYDPPMVGNGVTAIVIDTGIRKSHRGLALAVGGSKVVYEEDFSGSGNTDDIYDHGTAVAYLICGGNHSPGQESGIAPGASIINLKAINDDGEGTDETVIAALERALELWEDAVAEGLPRNDVNYPNFINMSFGTEDDGDPENPIRLAVDAIKKVATGNELTMVAAAGNGGPNPGTISLPAACEQVIAIGAVDFVPFQVWELSSRGPVEATNQIKPDIVFFGVNILLPSSANDTAFVVRSGTSFSCPVGMGFGCLLGELAVRMGPEIEEMMIAMNRDEFVSYLSIFSRKPRGVSMEKDNSYGYGMPMGDLVARAMTGAGLGDIGTVITDVMVPMMMVAMMAGMMKGMIKK